VRREKPWPPTAPTSRKDALLVCDTTEMCDALNRRIYDETIDKDAPTCSRSTEGWPRWEEPLSTIQNTRRAEA
jgi:hypothetical protein